MNKPIKISLAQKIETSEIYQTAKDVCHVLLQHGFAAYFVGGSVRDFILFPRQIPRDIDITTNAGVSDIEKIFPKSTLVGKSFGICVVKHKNYAFEVATFRKDGPYLDRRHPSHVSIGTLEEDSLRRDFTFNAFYFSPQNKQIIDLHGGLRDIKNKTIRCVGRVDDRIYEDSLRILRCLRFSSAFNFKIEKILLHAIQKYKSGLLLLPMERILDELSKVRYAQGFVEKFYQLLNVDLFFKSFSKKSLKHIQRSGLLTSSVQKFKFSEKSIFFDFFVMFCIYYKIDNFEDLQIELKAFPCATYDKKLCLWFLNLLQKGMALYKNDRLTTGSRANIVPYDVTKKPIFLFFKDMVVLERLEKNPNPQIFTILKKLIQTKIAVKTITKYTKTKDSFSMASEVQKLRSQNVPEQQYTSQLLLKRFSDILDL